MITYNQIPPVAVFKKDSAVNLALRNKDTFLVAIDGLLTKLPTAADDRFGMVIDLFLTLNSWLKAYETGQPPVEKGRYPAISALSEVVCNELMQALGVGSLGQLNGAVSDLIGRDISSHGSAADQSMHGMFFNDASREAKRLHFKSGKAYRYMADVPGKPKGLQPLDSQDFYNPNIVRDGARSLPGFAAFVMSMDRDFYMAKHFLNQASVFHSSYFGPGRKVAMAGTLLVKNGEVLGIRGDSGHYMPTPKQMANGIRALAALGVNIRQLKVYSWDPKDTAFQTGSQAAAAGQFTAPPRSAPPLPPRPGQGGMQFVPPGANYGNAPGNYGNYGSNYNNNAQGGQAQGSHYGSNYNNNPGYGQQIPANPQQGSGYGQRISANPDGSVSAQDYASLYN